METQTIERIVEAAAAAPSSHNTQPWIFKKEQDGLILMPDFSKRLPIVDPHNRALFISLGAALENLVLAAGHEGYACHTRYSLDGNPHIQIDFEFGAKNQDQEDLYLQIPKLHTNRLPYDNQPLVDSDLNKLRNLSLMEGVGVKVLEDGNSRKDIENLVLEGDKAQFHNFKFKKELVNWVRFNKEEVSKKRDGLTFETTGNPAVPRWLGSMVVFATTPNRQAKKDAKLLNSSQALALIYSEEDNMKAWLDTGRALERFLLTATSLHIQTAYMNQAVEVERLREKLKKAAKLESKWPQLTLRLGRAPEAAKSPRRPINEILQ